MIHPLRLTSLTSIAVASSFYISKKLNAKTCDWTLLGSGKRSVTFLSIDVYSLSLFADAQTVSNLIKSPLFNSFKAHSWSSEPIESAWYCKELLNTRGKLKLELDPIRDTTGSHLKSGWKRALEKIIKQESKHMIPAEVEAANAAIDEFLKEFPGSKRVCVGDRVAFIKDGGELEVNCGDLSFSIKNDWFAKNFIGLYFTESAPSLSFKDSVGQGLERILTR